MLRDARPLGFLLALGFVAAGCGSSTPPHGDGGATTLACATTSDCPSGQVCQGGLCVTPKQCNSDADCPSGESCDLLKGTCSQGTQQTDGGGVITDGGDGGNTDGGGVPSGGSCTTKYDCADGQVCGSNGTCTAPPTECTQDSDCPRGKICNFSNQCEPGCSSQKDCDAPMLCHPQKFICDYCSLSNPCPSGQSCVATSGGTALAHPQCEAAVTCSTTQDCATNAPGTVCKSGVCVNCTAHADCNVAPYNANPGNQSNPNPPICGPNGLCGSASTQSACTDQNCQSQLNNPDAYCDTSQNPPNCGVYQCTKDAECTNSDGTPGTCNLATHTCNVSGGGDGGTPGSCTGTALSTCQSQCATQTDPTSGQPETCNTSTCSCNGSSGGTPGGQCTTDSDCPSTQTCSMGICTDKAVEPGGAPCTSTDCLMSLFGAGGCVSATDGHQCSSTGCLMSMFSGGSLGGIFGGGGGGSGSGTPCNSNADCTVSGEVCNPSSSGGIGLPGMGDAGIPGLGGDGGSTSGTCGPPPSAIPCD